MITITTSVVCSYLKDRLPSLGAFIRNGNIDKSSKESIGVFLASDHRALGNLALGGIDCTVVRMLPINIKVRWSEDQQEHDDKSVEIYDALLTESDNFTVDVVKIAYIELLDSCPQSIGRDEKNVCESVIRANFHYYV